MIALKMAHNLFTENTYLQMETLIEFLMQEGKSQLLRSMLR